MHQNTEAERIRQAGYSIPEWCRAVGISRASYYNLPPGQQPRTAHIGRRHIVIEAPADFLNRIAGTAKRAA